MRPPLERLLARKILSFIRVHADKKASESAFNELALELFHFQLASNKVYRRYCDVAGEAIASVKGWRDIPAIPTAAFKEFALTCFSPQRAVKVFKTSGTTRGLAGRHYFRTLDLYDAAIPSPFEKYLLPDKARLSYHFLIASGKEEPASSLSYMMDRIQHSFAHGKGRHYVKRGVADYAGLARDLRSQKQPSIVLATAFSLLGFLDHLEAKGIKLELPPRSRVMETGGFKGRTREVAKQDLYERCARLLGIAPGHIVSEYGMTELSSQCYDSTLADRSSGRKTDGIKRAPEWMRFQVIDPATGKECPKGRPGHLKLVDLANIGSVAAILTEDRARAVGEGFELLGRSKEAPLRGCSLGHEDLISSSR